MEIKPLRTYTDTLSASLFPDLLLYWHWDDVTSGDTTWTDRISGVVLTSDKPILKDSEGLYTGQTATITCGTLPIPGQSAILVNVFKAASASATLGGVVTFGNTLEEGGPAISTNGQMSQTAVGTIAVATFASTPTGLGKNACRASALTATGHTGLCVLAHDDGFTSIIANDSTNAVTADLTEFATLPLTNSTVTLSSINGATDDGRRGRIIALFSPSADITIGKLQLACVDMARTKQLSPMLMIL